jgi:hypothetical protein
VQLLFQCLKHAVSRLKFFGCPKYQPIKHRGQEVELHVLLIPDVDGGEFSVSRPKLFRFPESSKKKKKAT